MNEALELAEEMQRYGVTTMNRWATDGATLIRSQHAEIERLKADANTCGSGAGCLHKLATIDSQAAEIERLKEDWSDHVAGYNLTIDALRAENAKLRLKALGTFEEWSDKNWGGVLSPNGREEYDAASAALGDAK